MRTSNEQSKDKFLVAAIEEMQDHGISDFSIRRVAEKCKVSSGAPYKHFKNKNDLILESIKYMNREWRKIQSRIIVECGDDPRKRLVEISVEYVKFLCANPAYQSILMLSDNSLSAEQLREKAKMSLRAERNIDKYCRSVGMSQQDKKRKTYAVRSFIFGAAFMINSGILENNEESFDIVRSFIEREFDID